MRRPNHSDPEASTTDGGRVAGFTSGDRFIVYDRENPAGWIESDASVSPEEMI